MEKYGCQPSAVSGQQEWLSAVSSQQGDSGSSDVSSAESRRLMADGFFAVSRRLTADGYSTKKGQRIQNTPPCYRNSLDFTLYPWL